MLWLNANLLAADQYWCFEWLHYGSDTRGSSRRTSGAAYWPKLGIFYFLEGSLDKQGLCVQSTSHSPIRPRSTALYYQRNSHCLELHFYFIFFLCFSFNCSKKEKWLKWFLIISFRLFPRFEICDEKLWRLDLKITSIYSSTKFS